MNENCQLSSLPAVPEKMGAADIFSQRIRKFRLSVWRRIRFLRNTIIAWQKQSDTQGKSLIGSAGIKAGDMVKIKSIKEIRGTLDGWNKLKGCGFMDEMEAYCGTMQRVKKAVRHFMDESDYRVKKCNQIVLLENVYCQGVKILGPCDRTCFFFWREEWLETLQYPLAKGDGKNSNSVPPKTA
jgi:hypothetical protein